MTPEQRVAEAIRNLDAIAFSCEFVKESVHFYSTHKDGLAADIRTILAELSRIQSVREASEREAMRRNFEAAGVSALTLPDQPSNQDVTP